MLNKLKQILLAFWHRIFPESETHHSIAGHVEGWPKTNTDYEEFWASKEAMDFYFEPSRLKFYDEILENIDTPQQGKILDIGCGNGFFLKKIADKNPQFSQANFFGVDYAESGLQVGRELLPQATLQKADAAQLPFPAANFSLVIMMETFEHLENWQGALIEAWRVLAKAGTLVITIPDGALDKWVGHTNFWTEAEFKQILQTYGTPKILRLDAGRTLLGIITK